MISVDVIDQVIATRVYWLCIRWYLTLPVTFISEGCFEIKIKFFFPLLGGASKGFMKAFKVFIKTFEVPQRSVKIKI